MKRRATELKHLNAHYERIEDNLESLAFCRKVYREYVEEGKPATPNMDADKATAQLLETIDRLLVAGR